MHTVEDRVREEIERLHAFLVGWFRGTLADEAFENDFLCRFAPGLLLIPPSGTTLTVDQFGAGTREAFGSNPDFKVAIRNVAVRKVWKGTILATYEEWQRNALASKPPNNGRVATVLFDDTQPLRWLHIHETWLPTAVAEAGPYDF